MISAGSLTVQRKFVIKYLHSKIQLISNPNYIQSQIDFHGRLRSNQWIGFDYILRMEFGRLQQLPRLLQRQL